jgi:hypothetical protein
MTDLTRYAKAAQHLPMAWLTQSEFPAKDLVKQSFEDAIAELPEMRSGDDSLAHLVRFALEAVAKGPDPRGGAFKAQAIYAAAQLHDRITALVLEPKENKPKVRVGSILHGYCGGAFGESYGHRVVTEKGDGWSNYECLDGPQQGHKGRYHGNIKELAEYLAPDHHCPDNCTFGEN